MPALRTMFACAFAAVPALAQFTYPGCDDLAAKDFKITEVFNRHGNNGAAAGDETMEEPVQFALDGVNKAGVLDHVDVYFVERLGVVKFYDGAAKRISEMGTVPVWAAKATGGNDNGLMGIALDPRFATNGWIYLWYSPPIANAGLNRRLHLGRFTMTPQHTLDMKSEKILIDILASKTDHWHSGGPMQFDSYGDLWIQVGNNSDDVDATGFSQYSDDSTSSDEWGPSNTASMRGGTLRIHPDDSKKGYSIPKGNFGEYWSAQWDKQGRADLAAQYRDSAKVLPEIYVKGERSNYSIWVHPTKRWLAWGTVNYESSRDEFNITDHPIFSGFPYFHGPNERVPGQLERLGALMDPAAPVNNSKLNSGVKELPPAVPGTVNGLAPVSIGGPVYLFDRNNPSATKFPPHLHNNWIGFDFKGSRMYLMKLDSANLTVSTRTQADNGLFKGISLRGPLGGHYGPDGALYLLNYDGSYSTINPGVTRIDYVGTCKVAAGGISVAERLASTLNISLSPATLDIRESGDHEFSLYDISGNRILLREGRQGAKYSLPDLMRDNGIGKGLLIVKVKTARGVFVRNLSFL